METTALALVERPVDVPTELSPFGQMIVILEGRNPGETATTHFGAVRWSGIPVRHILADAAALVIDAVGKRMDRVAETQADAKAIAERTEARLNVGLLLAHGSPALAANAFEAAMRDAVSVAARTDLGRRPTDPPALFTSVWTRPAYQFLVACVKRGREEAERLRPLVDRIERRNARFGPNHPVLVDAGSESELVTWLEEGGRPRPERACRLFLGLEENLVRQEAVLEAGIRVLKADHPLSGYELLANDTGLFEGWINTAILKVAAGDPSAKAGAISPEAAMRAHALVRQSDQARTVARVREIVRVRTAGMSEESRVDADAFVYRTATRHVRRLSRADIPFAIDRHFVDPYLSSGEMIELDHHQAIQYLVPSDVDGHDELPESVRDSVERALNWKRFDAVEVMDIINGGKIPVSAVVEHLGQLRTAVRTEIVKTLLDEHPELVNGILDGGHLAWKESVGQRFGDHLSTAYLERAVRDLLRKRVLRDERLLWCAPSMLRLPADRTRSIWEDPTLYVALLNLVDALLFEVRPHEVARRDIALLAAAAGPAFDRLALDAYARTRAEIYSDPDNRLPDYPALPGWADTASAAPVEWEFVRTLRTTIGARLRALLAENAEDDCFARTVAHKSNRIARLVTFQQSRREFFQRVPALPASP